MTSAQPTGNGQAPTGSTSSVDGTGQAPTTTPANNSGVSSAATNGQAPTSTPNDFTPPSADEWKRAQQELAEARRDAGRYRDELRKRDDASLTEQQKRERDFADLQAKASEYETRIQRLTLENAGFRHGASLGIGDIAAALALVQVEHGHELKYDAAGNPENIQDLLKAVLKNHPSLAASASATGTGNGRGQAQAGSGSNASNAGGATNPGRNAGNGGLTLEVIRAMPMRERMARLAEIEAWEKAQRSQQ